MTLISYFGAIMTLVAIGAYAAMMVGLNRECPPAVALSNASGQVRREHPRFRSGCSMLDFSFVEALLAGLFLAIVVVVAYAVSSDFRTQRIGKHTRQLESPLPEIRLPVDSTNDRPELVAEMPLQSRPAFEQRQSA